MTRTLRIKIALTGIVAAAACSPSDLLKVSNPDIINPTDVTTPGGVAALYAGAFGDFTIAAVSDNGGEAGLLLVTGQFSDELVNSETFPTRIEYDHRGPIDIKNSSLLTMFRRIHRARRSAEVAAAAIKAVDTAPLTDKRIGDMYALAGFIYAEMGEAYCNGMPVSDASLDGSLTFSDPLTTTQIYNRAVDRFDSALKYPRDQFVVHASPKHMRFWGVEGWSHEYGMTIILPREPHAQRPYAANDVLTLTLPRLARDVEEFLRWFNSYALSALARQSGASVKTDR